MIETYIIHLPRSTERKDLVQKLEERLPNAKVLDAVDGREMPESERQSIITDVLYEPRYPFGVTPSELGCFLSHRKVWQQIGSSAATASIVVEDDIALLTGFEASLETALSAANERSFIRFPLQDREVPPSLKSTVKSTVFRPEIIGLSTGMYVIGREAAAQLLARSEKIDRAIDAWLQMRWETGIDNNAIWPSYIASASHETGGSTIQSKRSLYSELGRVWKRSKYRQQIAKLSKAS